MIKTTYMLTNNKTLNEVIKLITEQGKGGVSRIDIEPSGHGTYMQVALDFIIPIMMDDQSNQQKQTAPNNIDEVFNEWLKRVKKK